MSMNDFTSFAFLATIAALWSQIRTVFDRVRGLFIQRTTLSGNISTTVSDFLYSNARIYRWGDALIRSESAWVRPKQRVMEVAYEGAPTKPVLAVWNGSPLLFQSPHSGQSTPGIPDRMDILTITSLRGTLDLVTLTRAAIEWQSNRETTGHRYRVRHIGGKGQQNREANNLAASPRAPEITRPGTRYLHWDEQDIGSPKPANPFDSYALSPTTAAARDDFKRWCQLKTWYLERGIPWRRGHLLYGPPGTGKTALVRALAQEADFPVFAFDLSTLGNDEFRYAWMDMQESAPCIALIEDIDGVFHGRENVLSQHEGMRSSLTFDCLLNALGGIQTADGIFVVITTNKPELLDEALGKPDTSGTTSRPGRLDRAFCLPAPNVEARLSIICRICGQCTCEDLGDTAEMSAAQVTEWSISKALQEMWKGDQITPGPPACAPTASA